MTCFRTSPLKLALQLMVAGMLVNVLVAWGLAAWLQHANPGLNRQQLNTGPIHENSGHPVQAGVDEEWRQGIMIVWTTELAPHPRSYGHHTFGWPYQSLLHSNNISTRSTLRWTDVLHLGKTRLPMKPRLASFIANTFFWAGLLCLIAMGSSLVRRTRRRRRGLCMSCAYDMSGSAAQCPECGALRPELLHMV